MELYIAKSTTCLTILLLFYKVFLEKESFHVFKRFYLLGSIIVSFCIPLITFIKYVDPELVLGSFLNPIDETILNVQNIETENVERQFYWTYLLWSIYTTGVLFFSIRFLLNLTGIVQRIRKNTKLKSKNFINVLLNDLVIPHTFFNYIFLNKFKFEKHEIPEEVILHERIHAKQKHSIDILFIEILQIAFWFNPLIYLIKDSIKLNHEFLADQAVMNQGVSLTTYQQTLLAFSSNAKEPQLANAINYSSIKKRFTVMKTQTSKRNMWLKSLVLLPLLSFMVYGFSTTKEIEIEFNPLMDINPIKKHTARSIELKILEDGNYLVDGIKTTKNNLIEVFNTLHQDITPEIRKNIMNIHVSSEKEVSKNEVWFIYNSLWEYGFHRIVVPNQEVVREKGNTPFKVNEQELTIPFETHKKDVVDQVKKELEEAGALIINYSDDQKSATPEQMAEYNRLAKHYNVMLKRNDNLLIKVKDMKRLKHIYNIMSDKQRKDAEPFPDFPEPPPPPPAPKTPKTNLEYSKPRKLNEESDIPPPPPPTPESPKVAGYAVPVAKDQNDGLNKLSDEYNKIQGLKNRKQKETLTKADKKQIKVWEERQTELKKEMHNHLDKISEEESSKIPPPPPAPDAPPTMKELANKGAIFYLEGKVISSKKAIETVNTNKNINISIQRVDSKKPIVKLSKKPISF